MPSSSPYLVHKAVRAGAGAGKTTNLTQTVLQLASQFKKDHKRWPRVIVSTFTRKATQELKERLLVKALQSEPELIDFVQNRNELFIGTLHSVMDRFLKLNAQKLGLPPSFEIVSSAALKQLKGRVLRDLGEKNKDVQTLLMSYGYSTILQLLDAYTQMRVLHPEAKTPTYQNMVSEVSETVESIASQIYLLATDALKLSLRENHQKYFSALVENLKEVVSTKDWIAFLELSDDLSGASAQDIESYRPTSLEFLSHLPVCRASKQDDPLIESIYKETNELVKALKDLKWSTFTLPHLLKAEEHAFLFDILTREFDAELNKYKTVKGQIALSEIELLTYQLIQTHPDVAQRFSEDYDYWMIDEFQDTSPLQVQIFEKLIGATNRYIVGDPQQSIYLFRGARSRVFESEIDKIKNLNGSLSFLNKNYRSQASLMEFLNEVVPKLPGNFSKMETKDNNFSEDVVATIGVFKDTDEESLFVAKSVIDLLEKGIKADQIAILVRSHSQVMSVAQTLSEFHLPFSIHSSGQFAEQYEIQDAFSFLKFLAHPHDDQNLIQLLRSPWMRLSDEAISLAQNQKAQNQKAAGVSLWEFFVQSQSNEIAWLKASQELQRRLGYFEVFKKFIFEKGLLESHLIYDGSGQREANLYLLLAKLHESMRRPHFNLLEFLDEQNQRLGLDEGDKDGIGTFASERVHLMTIHASKGLEFEHVIVPFLASRPMTTNYQNLGLDESKGIWFLRSPLGADEKLSSVPIEKAALRQLREAESQESWRVFYVALTRAIKHLTLSWSGNPSAVSWASALTDWSSEGVHKTNHFVYEVVKSFELPLSYKSSRHSKEKVSSKYQSPELINRTPKRSVTALLESESLPNRVLAHMAEKAAVGTKVHRLFELLKYPSQNKLKSLITLWFPDEEDRVQASIEFVRDSKDPEILSIIKNGEVEWGFATTISGQPIEGQIDLWGRDDHGRLWIVDYKSGTSKLSEKAFSQLEVYSLALRSIWPAIQNEEIRLLAVFPFEEKFVVRTAKTYDQSLAQFLELVIVKEE